MTNGLVVTIIILASMAVISLIIFAIIKVSKKIRPDVPPNSNLIISLDPQLTKGHSIGVKMTPDDDLINNKNHTSGLIKMRPIDVSYDKDGKPVEMQPVKFAVRRNLVFRCPAGSLSHYRTVEIIFPSSSAQLDGDLLETQFGRLLAEMVEKANDTDNLLDTVRKSNLKRKVQHDLMDETQEKVVEYQRGMLRELFDNKTKEKKEEQ